jgi:hypothetical protein
MGLPHSRRWPRLPGAVDFARWIVRRSGCGRRALISASAVEAENSRASSASSVMSSGSGQDISADRACCRKSMTVVAPIDRLNAILRLEGYFVR